MKRVELKKFVFSPSHKRLRSHIKALPNIKA
jgi:hypothetical protein